MNARWRWSCNRCAYQLRLELYEYRRGQRPHCHDGREYNSLICFSFFFTSHIYESTISDLKEATYDDTFHWVGNIGWQLNRLHVRFVSRSARGIVTGDFVDCRRRLRAGEHVHLIFEEPVARKLTVVITPIVDHRFL